MLFTATPGRGHIHPMVPLARAFVDRGDQVLWASAPEACARLRGEGFEATAAGLAEREGMAEVSRRFPEIGDLAPPERPDFLFPRLFGAVRAAPMLYELLPVAERWSPDLLVCDASDFAGPLVAAVVGVPNVTHAFGTLLPPTRVAAAGEEVAGLWAAHGREVPPYGGCYQHLYLDIYPPSLQPGERPHVPASQHLGPSLFATAGDESVPGWVTAPTPEPLVYVTFGTVFGNDAELATVVEAVGVLPVRVVVTVGPHGDPAALGPQPPNVHVAHYVPQDQLLPHGAAVVSHGGSGTFLAALAARLPQLCVPQAADQFLNAAACARSGVGLVVGPGRVSVEGVRDAVERLLAEPGFRAAAERVSDEIAAMPSPPEVAERLKELVP